MKSWSIWDFPGTIYVYLKDDFREEFFDKMFKKCGGKKPYSRFLGISQMSIKQYAKSYTYKNGVKHPQAIPISIIKKSLSLMDKKLKQKIESNIHLLKVRGNSKTNRNDRYKNK